ncbi:beta-amyrin 28-monooxygenase-like [Andrographis paniculata]|uniref:beta-amyrin 28-monooxygenase-like n=1 Tax=Andrographis paniculata TaxID=175694 RepID=UPI0021E6EC95|nr:beta-amyrin 28-monooxygenase-like [Andrographis paniculata]
MMMVVVMISLFLIAIIVLVVVVVFFVATSTARKQQQHSPASRKNLLPLPLPPGSYGWPILGETLEFIRARNQGFPGCNKFVRVRMERYKSEVIKTSLMGERVAVLGGPAGNKFLFSNEHKLVTLWWPASVSRLLGECISTSPGARGMRMRKMASHFFSPDAFNKLAYIDTMGRVTRRHLCAHWQGRSQLVVYPAVKLFTFELACRLFMSIQDPDRIQRLEALFRAFTRGVISIPLYLPGTKFYKAVRATAKIKEELAAIVRERKKALLEQEQGPNDLLSHLLVSPDEEGRYMSESVIVNNILLMLFAGHDTSSSALTMVIKVLAEHPHVYKRVLAEQNEITKAKGGQEPSSLLLQWEDIQKMRYTWNVVCETIRLWPPVGGAFREALTDISYGGYRIPKGWKFYWSSPVTHEDSKLFADSSRFDPSRFEEEAQRNGGNSSSAPPPYAYVPFGGGPRMCLGKEFARLEMLVFLHNVVPRFRWSLVDPHEKILCDPIPAPEKGLPIRLHPAAIANNNKQHMMN